MTGPGRERRGVRTQAGKAASDGASRSCCFLLVILLFLSLGAPLRAAGETIRVAIEDDRRSVVMRAPSGLIVDGQDEGATATQITVRPGEMKDTLLRLRAQKGLVRVDGKSYRGAVEVRRKRNGRLQVINELAVEDYLKGVVAAEVPSDWEAEVLKAQAVASRTYALYQKRSRSGRNFHIGDTVEHQVYLGVRAERPQAVAAVNATEGEVLLYDGEIIAAFYHSSCGGHTEDAEVLWGIDEPYLKGVDCDCQRISTYGLWEKRFSVAAVRAALRRGGYRLGNIEAVESGNITPGGRVQDVLFRTKRGTTPVPSELVRAALGYSRVPSIFFEPELIDGEVVFSGRGLGHGIGLCQWGARELAQKGSDYRSILRHYYPGTTIGRVR